MEPIEVDVIILGTSLRESILAAALAKSGKSVCHLDRNDFYGEHFGAFNLKSLLKFFHDVQGGKDLHLGDSYENVEIAIYPSATTTTRDVDIVNDGSDVTGASDALKMDTEPSVETHIVDAAADTPQDPTVSQTPASLQELLQYLNPDFRLPSSPLSSSSTSSSETNIPAHILPALNTLTALLKQSREFSLDLTPKVLYCSGDIVNLLIKSQIGHYLEFKAVDKIFIHWEGVLETVPSSKEDVFKNQSVSLVDKRRLMKLMTSALAYESVAEDSDKKFVDYLHENGIKGKLEAVLFYALAFQLSEKAVEHVTVEDGLKACQSYLLSLGRFGETGFLEGIYGTGSELCQAFCRVCAVFGGIYILNFEIDNIKQCDGKQQEGSSSKYKYIVTGKDGTVIRGRHRVTSNEYSQYSENPKKVKTKINRGIAILNGSIRIPQFQSVTVIPPNSFGNSEPIVVLQHTNETHTAPLGKTILYLFTTSCSSQPDYSHLDKAIQFMIDFDQEPALAKGSPDSLMKLFFQQNVYESEFEGETVSSLQDGIDVERAVKMAEKVFYSICSADTEFFPKAETVEGDT
ncbi:hypothetical protein HDV05_003053 [Chytridiales sp. JEL 0842]|nr:hypothetical protein HDV05_003053 [Chytridiales sp. JEL 0842]